MKGLVDQIASNLGIEPQVAEQSIAIILNILRKYAPNDKFDTFLNAVPGFEDLLSRHSSKEPSSTDEISNPFADLLSSDDGNALMDLMTQMQSAGLDMDQAKVIGLDVLEYAKSNAGIDVVKDVTDSIPGLSQFL